MKDHLRRSPGSWAVRLRAVTLLELMVVVLIIGILATIATNVYTGQTRRAKIAAAQDTIRELAVAITRYEIDTGELPLSGSGTVTPNVGTVPAITSRAVPANFAALNNRNGAGLLYLELVHSLSGDVNAPYPGTWNGPYLSFNAKIIQTTNDFGVTLPFGQAQILDSFGFPFEYVSSFEYNPNVPLTKHFDITALPQYPGQGTQLFPGAKPFSAAPELPANNIFASTETYYNPTTFQIFSVGPNGTTYDGVIPPADDPGTAFMGTEADDVNNFGF